MKQKLFVVAYYIATFIIPINAFIYESKVMRIWVPEQNEYHYFIGCSDFHDHTHPLTQLQRETIEKILAQAIHKSDIKVLVEDLSYPSYDGRYACGRFFLGPKGGILSGLAQFCKNNGLDVDNVEYRFCRVVALGPVMDQVHNNEQLCNDKLPSTCNTQISMLHQEVDALITEIRSFDDGQPLNNYYAQCTKSVENRCNEIHITKQSQMSAADYIASHTTDLQRIGQLNYLLTFDSGLVEAHLIHKIVTAKDKKTVIAFAGGTHIAAVSSLLATIGYETVYECKTNLIKEYSLNNCSGSSVLQDTHGSYCLRPSAISLDFLSGYI